MTPRTAGNGRRSARRTAAARAFLFLCSALLLVAAGYFFSRLPTSRKRPPGPAVSDAANERLAVLAIEGLLYESGVARTDPPPVAGTADRLSFQVDSAFRVEPLLDKLSSTLSLLGYQVQPPSRSGQGEAETVTVTARPLAPAPGRGDLTIVLARWHVPPVSSAAVPHRARSRAAIIIDDLGLSRELAERAASIPAAFTLAIMPMQPASEEAAHIAARHGRELLLHLPMEPLESSGKDPGPGALLTGMTAEEMARVLRDDLRTVPGAVGVNNHMGSKLTTDEAAMDILMGWLGNSHLLFLDSRTVANSSAYREARNHGVRAARRDIFLDNVDEPEAITSQIDELIRLSLMEGEAVGIGHPRENTLAVLSRNLDRFKKAGVDIVPLSRLAR